MTTNTTKTIIPVIPCPYGEKGHFVSRTKLVYKGRQYDVGGWDCTGRGRKMFGAGLEAGPHAFATAAAVCIDNDYRAGRETDALAAAGRLVPVETGDVLELAGTSYKVLPGLWLEPVAA